VTATSTQRDTASSAPSKKKQVKIGASIKPLKGTIAMLSAGFGIVGATATGKIGLGRYFDTYDNSSGADGDITGEYEWGEFKWANGDSIVQADVGKVAYIGDNQTAYKDSTGRSPLGQITRIDSDGVWVFTPEDMATIVGEAATGATASSATPQLLGNPAAGAGTSFSRDDHVHGTDSLPIAYQHAGDAAAADTLAEHVFHVASGKSVLITAVKIEADAAVTADNTNDATITVKQGDGAGGARSTVATLVTNVAGGSWVAFTAKDMGAITNATVPAGGIITITIAKGAAGVQLPKFRLAVFATTDV
jgi:hypothetical protein